MGELARSREQPSSLARYSGRSERIGDCPRAGGGEGDFDHRVEYREREQESAAADLPAILADRSLWWLLHPPRVAIVGRPNVGKSTLANQLFARERSITADLPGTTRDWVGELADVNGLAVMLVDTPGLRDAADPIERAAIAGARGQIAAADLVVARARSHPPARARAVAIAGRTPGRASRHQQVRPAGTVGTARPEATPHRRHYG